MKTTIEISDDLFRRAKAAAAMQGRSLKDFVAAGLRKELGETAEDESGEGRALTLHDRMKDLCGIIGDEVPSDYATNEKYMQGFGE